ncbi:hypothetical protein ALC56_02562 [Trachymyrmex septentrionalis]|uniref:Secreted protein n=1 Tax=Trachymyrmex septentrionalis TaxID=34720 RepID=A0A195FQ95_9HYME|nr:hypothetical protein ALC56_02562 [Trachymyrmex septentrionalis]
MVHARITFCFVVVVGECTASEGRKRPWRATHDPTTCDSYCDREDCRARRSYRQIGRTTHEWKYGWFAIGRPGYAGRGSRSRWWGIFEQEPPTQE